VPLLQRCKQNHLRATTFERRLLHSQSVVPHPVRWWAVRDVAARVGLAGQAPVHVVRRLVVATLRPCGCAVGNVVV